MSNRYIVIMAGGNGERFWPESRKALPKQFLSIVGSLPMLTQTVKRLEGLVEPKNIFVITGSQHRSVVLDICPELDPEKVIGEPIGRDTAPAVALATSLVVRENPDAVFAMLPADSVIHDHSNFRSILDSAFQLAEQKAVLVTIGIKPTHPATGYGYIQKANEIGTYGGEVAYRVNRFVEKPNLEKANEYLSSGDFYWNAGMFVWSIDSIREEFEKNSPNLWASVSEVGPRLDAGENIEAVLSDIYPGLEKISIDYAIIEKAQNVVVFESKFDWDDVGEWSAIERHYESDASGNAIRGEAEVIESKNNIVFNRDSGHIIALMGVEDLIVVRTKDATLICKKDQSQAVKKMVQSLSKNKENTDYL